MGTESYTAGLSFLTGSAEFAGPQLSEIHTVLFSVAVLILAIYTLLIAGYAIGWISIQKSETATAGLPKISVIIAARNEEDTLPVLLQDVLRQDYPKNHMEIIVADDHSTDATARVARSFPEVRLFQLLDEEPKTTGKKAALKLAMGKSQGDILLFTDADCRVSPLWAQRMVTQFKNPWVMMVSGPVLLSPHNLFGRVQQLEFTSLVASAAGSLNLGLPLMANGANLALRSRAAKNVSGKQQGNHLASGDDMFLMFSVVQHYGRHSLVFEKSREATVTTRPANSVKEFLHQRIRWASKSNDYPKFYAKATALLVLLLNAMLLTGMLTVPFFPHYTCYLIFAFVLKTAADLLLLVPALHFFRQLKNLYLFLPLQFMYPFYIGIVGILALISSPKWKGRELRLRVGGARP